MRPKSLVLSFIAGEPLQAGEAVWLCMYQTSRSPTALTTVRRILGGPHHTASDLQRSRRDRPRVPVPSSFLPKEFIDSRGVFAV